MSINKLVENMGANILAGMILAGIIGTVTVASMAATTSSRVDDIETNKIPSITQDMREFELTQHDNTKLIIEIYNDIKWIKSRTP